MSTKSKRFQPTFGNTSAFITRLSKNFQSELDISIAVRHGSSRSPRKQSPFTAEGIEILERVVASTVTSPVGSVNP